MKRLPLPALDDAAVLTQLAAAPRLDLQKYAARMPAIQQQYQTYVAVGGNASGPGAPRALRLPADLKSLLRGYYKRHVSFPELHEITTFLSRTAECCAMCGSPHPTTLDHVFPKSKFAEFSIFSRNLVPACDCNRLRGVNTRGRRPGQHVLHPYFDDLLTQRLVISEPSAVRQSFATPRFTLTLQLLATNPWYPALRFHVRNGLRRTRVLDRHGRIWSKIALHPEIHLDLPNGAVDVAAMNHAIARKVAEADNIAGTPNSWDSMFWSGIAASGGAKQHLLRRVTRLRAHMADPAIPDP
jgi:hypothetical protein